MTDSIKDTVPKVLKNLWDMENDLRSAAQNGVFLRREEARQHLAAARNHLDELLGIARAQDGANDAAPATPSTNSVKE